MTAAEIVRQFMAEKGVGRDLIERSMHRPFPQLRKELALRLINAGYGTCATARAMGLKNHSAVIMMFSPRREQKLARMREYSRRRRKWI